MQCNHWIYNHWIWRQSDQLARSIKLIHGQGDQVLFATTSVITSPVIWCLEITAISIPMLYCLIYNDIVGQDNGTFCSVLWHFHPECGTANHNSTRNNKIVGRLLTLSAWALLWTVIGRNSALLYKLACNVIVPVRWIVAPYWLVSDAWSACPVIINCHLVHIYMIYIVLDC